MTQRRGKLRKFAGIVLTLAMLLGLLPVSALAAETVQFDDTAGHWGEASIQRVVQEGLFNISVLVPALGFALLAAILWFWYPLHKKQVDENVIALKKKHASEA